MFITCGIKAKQLKDIRQFLCVPNKSQAEEQSEKLFFFVCFRLKKYRFFRFALKLQLMDEDRCYAMRKTNTFVQRDKKRKYSLGISAYKCEILNVYFYKMSAIKYYLLIDKSEDVV